ncbi:MAG: metallophosphoesterase [Bacteroidales bacterium]|nr:metallophosphoesterase [Bacteroidales bacterium]
MLFFILLIIIEVLTIAVLKEHFYNTSKLEYYISIIFHVILSIWLWILLIEIVTYKGLYEASRNVWLHMNMRGMICAVICPRILIIIFHYAGRLARMRNGGYYRCLTNSGLIIAFLIFSVVAFGTLTGRFNFKTEEITIRIKDLNTSLNGLKIIHLSDMHLSGFYHHRKLLEEAIERINSYQPDIIVNTGDFVTYGWREFEGTDTILAAAKGRYGNFAVFGNHDTGIYLPLQTDSVLKTDILRMNEMIHSSGYTVLNDGHTIIDIKGAKVAIIGVTTGGRHPDIIHGDLKKAVRGLDSVDFRILLCHDPNQWEEDVTGQTDIELTLAGHTHGMQIGILTKKFRWSPSKYFYPHWNGLFSKDDQYLYVNRGFGVLAVPFRIWMPPEITVIKLETE